MSGLLLSLTPKPGSDAPALSPRVITQASGLMLGRGGEGLTNKVDLRVKHPAASRRHCRLDAEQRGDELALVLRDFSTNGTFVNGKLQTVAVLREGDELSISDPKSSQRSCCWLVSVAATSVSSVPQASKAPPLGPLLQETAPPQPISFRLHKHLASAAPIENQPRTTTSSSTSNQPSTTAASDPPLSGGRAVDEANAFFSKLHITPCEADKDQEPDESLLTQLAGLSIDGNNINSNHTSSSNNNNTNNNNNNSNNNNKNSNHNNDTNDNNNNTSLLAAATWLEQGLQGQVQQDDGRPPSQCAVIDTNQLLDELAAVDLIRQRLTGLNLVVPLVVLKELEGLQVGSGQGSELSGRQLTARQALRYLQSTFLTQGDSRFVVWGDQPSRLLLQQPGELLPEMLPARPNADDQILACAAYFQAGPGSRQQPGEAEAAEAAGCGRGLAAGRTELLTADKGLATKAWSLGVACEEVGALLSRGERLRAEATSGHALGPAGSAEDRRQLVFGAHAQLANAILLLATPGMQDQKSQAGAPGLKEQGHFISTGLLTCGFDSTGLT
ncbi:unnamed protein product [Polarella glacialis]|uniref:FHA domain-containing protein n=1 Tax=Polarella glacialis TaxID=89957 RepID=A0A813I134_POLGL|nr:unnamed protein product [Polarella glacialis]